jgi:hypothetical protein
MKQVTYGDRSVLVGDDAADTLIEYGAAVARSGGAETVRLRVISPIGDDVVATFLLDSGTSLFVETVPSKEVEPENDDTVDAVRGRLETLLREESPAVATALDRPLPEVDDLDC